MFKSLKQHLDEGNIQEFKQLVRTSLQSNDPVNLNQVDEKGNSLLHNTVLAGKLQFVKFLVGVKSDVTLQNKEGDTILHLAAKKGYFNIVDELLGISSTAKARMRKKTWDDKDRNLKLNTVEAAQKQALALLKVNNINKEIPLTIAANLPDDRIYKKLLTMQPGYEKDHLDSILTLRKKRLTTKKISVFFAALLESFCPSSSIVELTESFSYIGLSIGATAAVALGINIAFSVIAILGLGMITFANFQKIKAERNAKDELENDQVKLAFIMNINKRLQQLSQEKNLSDSHKKELSVIRDELSNNTARAELIKGNETSAADYITKKEKVYTVISALGSFLCAYSGLLGIVGLGLGLTAASMGIGMGALIISAGPIGVGIALGVSILLAAGLAIYHYKKLKQDYLAFGELRMSINKQQDAIYREKQQLIHTNTMKTIDELLVEKKQDNVEPELSNQATATKIPTITTPSPNVVASPASPTNRSDQHGHGPGELCEIEIGLLKTLSFSNVPVQVNKPVDVNTSLLQP